MSQTETVTVTVTSLSLYDLQNPALIKSKFFSVTFLNPCIDQAYVTIQAPTYAKKTYTIDCNAFTFDPEGEFTFVTTPHVGHTLCGDLNYVAKYDNVVMDGDPLVYNEATREFTAFSEDDTLIGLTDKPYSVEVEFVNYPLSTYPTVATNSAASTIDFIDPCLEPFKFESKS